MPDSSKDAEVDSVLAAIRRLIAEGRPDGEAPAPAAMERLVLTPALRVDGRPAPLVLTSALPAAPAVPDVPAAAGLDRLLAASDTLILMNARTAAPPALGPSDPVEAELSLDPGALDALAGAVPFTGALDGAAPVRLDLSGPLEAELSVDPGALDASLADAPPVARLDEGPAATPAADAPNPPAASEGPAPDVAEAASPGAQLANGEAVVSGAAALPPLVLVPAKEQPPQAPAPDLRAVPVGPDPDAPPGDPSPTPAEAGQLPDAPSAGLSEEAPPAPVPTAVASLPEAAPDTPREADFVPPLPDEATLRALVAEAVRKELQGELGERLTRNLRKLVRREVMQALALRER